MTHIFLGNRSGCKTFQFRIFSTLVQTLIYHFKSFILMKEVKWTSALQTIKSEKQKERNEDLHLTSNITLWKREKICDTHNIANS